MLNPDEIPYYIAIPTFIILCIVWRRQVIAERRKIRKLENDNR